MIKFIERLFIISIILGLFFLSLYSFFMVEQEEISELEKRRMSTNQELEELSMLDPDYSKKVESILADQFFNRYVLVEDKKELDHSFSEYVYQFVDNPFILKQVGDTPVYQIGDTPYLTAYPLLYNEDYEARILNRIEQINALAKDYPNIDVFVYKPTQLIETDLLDQANGIESAGALYTSLFETKLEVPFSSLELKGFDDYTRYLYYSDHHWTHQGSYQGYLDIVELTNPSIQDVLVPWGENCFEDMRFYGTTSVMTGKITEASPFCVYGYTMPPYILWYEGVIQDIHYDSNNFYFVGTNNREGYHYDDAYSLIKEPITLFELENQQIDAENILIIGDSYAPPVLPLLTHHFSHIYYVNPITYQSIYNETFKYDSFIKDHNIENILFMYIIDNYVVSDEWGERYKLFDIVRD